VICEGGLPQKNRFGGAQRPLNPHRDRGGVAPLDPPEAEIQRLRDQS
jgi:hypothetical protein